MIGSESVDGEKSGRDEGIEKGEAVNCREKKKQQNDIFHWLLYFSNYCFQ